MPTRSSRYCGNNHKALQSSVQRLPASDILNTIAWSTPQSNRCSRRVSSIEPQDSFQEGNRSSKGIRIAVDHELHCYSGSINHRLSFKLPSRRRSPPSIHPSPAACLVQRLTSTLADKRIQSSKKHSHLSVSKGNLSAGYLSCANTLQQQQSKRQHIRSVLFWPRFSSLLSSSPGQQGGGGDIIERENK